MSKNWDLTALYNGFDEAFETDLKLVQKNIKDIVEFTNNGFGEVEETIVKYLELSESITKTLRKVSAYINLVRSTDTLNEDANKYMDVINQLFAQLTAPTVKFKMWLKDVDHIEELAGKNDFIHSYLFSVNETKESASHLLSEQEEVLYSKLRMNASSSWTKLHGQLTSSLMIDVTIDNETKTLPLSSVRNLAYSSDQTVRKEAYEKELAAYKRIEDTIALALSNIKREVNTMSELRGYESPIAMTLNSSRMSEKTLNAMINAMKEYLPIFRTYLKKKAEYLGYDKAMPFYDMFAPVGSLTKTFTYEEACNLVVDNFRSFSDKLADFAKMAIDSNWIDVEPRNGKVGGAFCMNLPMMKQSRFLLNFTGAFSNVTTLAHELGHGYHGQVIAEEQPLNWGYPMPLAETASILCETIVTENLLKTLTDEEQLTVLEASLMSDTQVIVDILSRFIFESNVFENTREFGLSANKLKDLMIQAQKETYGDGLDNDFLHPYMWVNKGHYYNAGLNFYNFPYAFGALYGKGLYSMYLNDKDAFVQKYDEMLAQTGKNTIEEVAATMGIDVTSEAFWRSSLDVIKKDVEKFSALVDQLK